MFIETENNCPKCKTEIKSIEINSHPEKCPLCGQKLKWILTRDDEKKNFWYVINKQ